MKEGLLFGGVLGSPGSQLRIMRHGSRIAIAALQLLGVILSEGKASRLYQRMVEREQSVSLVTAEYGESMDPTLFHVRAEARGEHPIEQIETSIHDELRSIATQGVTPHEIDRAKHQIEAHFIFSRDAPRSIHSFRSDRNPGLPGIHRLLFESRGRSNDRRHRGCLFPLSAREQSHGSTTAE